MKDILTIIFRLTLSCVLAASIMGICFVFTNNAKKHNEHVKEQEVRYQLLGYSKTNPPPESMAMHEMYRYVITGANSQSIGYIVPAKHDSEQPFLFINISLDGKLIESKPLELTETEALEPEPRLAALQALLDESSSAVFADQIVVVTDNGKRIAYLLDGKFQGFKTFIKVMLAVDPAFAMLGLEILEHEEDPGLGAEIEQNYFKNQFQGKPFDFLKTIDVVKEPIPADYLQALNGELEESDISKFREQYKNNDIYALTGATISSKAVSNGVKNMVTKFAYRVNVLDTILSSQQIAVSF